jgi:hypothetical protein
LALTLLFLGVTMQLPGAPYNVKELFGEKSLWLGLPALSLFLLWSAGAPNLLARITIICPWLNIVQPLLFLLLAVPAWWLLQLSVSNESLFDVFGRSVWGWTGDWELFIRFLGLAGPVFLMLFYWNLLFEGSAWIDRRFGIGQLLVALVLGLPMLWLSKLIVVDYAATDRVIMLSAQGPSWQVGGALALVMALVTFNGVFLGWMSLWSNRRRVLALVLTPILFLASWRLLLQGLSPEGILLLLGHGEQGEQSELLVRWGVVYGGAIVVIALAHLIPFRLRGGLETQRGSYARGNLHDALSPSNAEKAG